MMDYSHLHEVEWVEFRSNSPRQSSELLAVFMSQGFTLHDDVVSLDRKETVPPWQHPSVVEVEVRRNGVEVFGFDGEWDTVQMKYLFASLPFEKTDQFLDAVAETSKKIGLPPEHRGRRVTIMEMRIELARMRDELISETGEDAGSEGLAILIHSTYPRG